MRLLFLIICLFGISSTSFASDFDCPVDSSNKDAVIERINKWENYCQDAVAVAHYCAVGPTNFAHDIAKYTLARVYCEKNFDLLNDNAKSVYKNMLVECAKNHTKYKTSQAYCEMKAAESINVLYLPRD